MMKYLTCQVETMKCNHPVKYMLAEYRTKRTSRDDFTSIGVCGIHIVTGLKEIGDPRLAVIGHYDDNNTSNI